MNEDAERPGSDSGLERHVPTAAEVEEFKRYLATHYGVDPEETVLAGLLAG